MNTLNPVFKIVIIHEDVITGLQATDVLKRLAAQLEARLDVDINPWQSCNHIWKFEWLEDPELREQAVAESVEADIIIISAGGGAELPVCVRNLIEDVLLQKQGGPAALVALLDNGQNPRSVSSPPGIYLRQVAEQCGVDFFCSSNDRPQRAESGIDSIISRLEDDSGILKEALPCDSSLRGWGIND